MVVGTVRRNRWIHYRCPGWLTISSRAPSSRAAGELRTRFYGGHERFLRQTVIAIVGGHELGEHESPGEATLQVLRGRVKVHAGTDTWDGAEGDFLVIPPARHSVEAVEDAVLLLSVRADSRESG